MRHALAQPGSIGALSIGVIRPPFGAGLVAPPGAPDLLAPRKRAASGRAIQVTAIAASTDVEVRAASRTAPCPKLLHPTLPAEEVSTGDLSRNIISSETKRLHPRGASAATGAPVSSTSEREPQPRAGLEPVSGLPGSRATPRSLRSSARGLPRSSPPGHDAGAPLKRLRRAAGPRARGPIPGHDAGAPLKRWPDLRLLGPILRSPATMPGLH